MGGEIEWDKPTQGWVLSSFFYGYIVTQVIGGYLSGRFGGKRVMLTGMLVYGVSTLLIPAAARCVTVYLACDTALVVSVPVLGIYHSTSMEPMKPTCTSWILILNSHVALIQTEPRAN